MTKKLTIIIALVATIMLLAACATPADPDPIAENCDYIPASQFTQEHVGDLGFVRPSHWAAFLAQLEPHEGVRMEFWDADYYDDQPFFRVQQLPMEVDELSLDDLLAQTLDEVELENTTAEIAPIVYPIDAVYISGTNGGMEITEIRFVHNGWLYAISASHSQYNDEHQSYVISMLQSLGIVE